MRPRRSYLPWLTDPTPAGLLVHLTIWALMVVGGVVLAAEPAPAREQMTVHQVEEALLHWARLTPRHPVHRAAYRFEVASALHGAAVRHGVPVEVVTAMALRESSAREDVTGPAGELGLLQVHPQTAVRYKCRLETPEQQADCGCRILAAHLQRCGEIEGALAAYGSRSGSCTPPAGGSVARMVRDRLALAKRLRATE